MNITIITYTKDPTIQSYYQNVVVFDDAALRIRQFGFPNAKLWIEGELLLSESKNIIFAEKIAFLDDSEPDTSNMKNYIGRQGYSNEQYLVH